MVAQGGSKEMNCFSTENWIIWAVLLGAKDQNAMSEHGLVDSEVKT